MKISKIAMLINEDEVMVEDKDGMFQIVSRETLLREFCLNDIDFICICNPITMKHYLKIKVKENIWT